MTKTEIAKLLKKFNLEAYLVSHGGVPDRQSKEWCLVCPGCGREKIFVNLEKRSWHCWVCEEYRVSGAGKRIPVKGAGGVLALIQWLEGCDRPQALARLKAGKMRPADHSWAVGGDLGRSEGPVGEPVSISPPPYWTPIYGSLPYCLERGITSQDVVNFGLGFCSGGRYRNRLVFPVWEGKRLVYWQARAMWGPVMGETYIKSLNPPKDLGALGPSEVLMNLDTAKYFERVAIVEGPIDNVHVGPSAVCTFGKRISATQILKLWKAGVRKVDLMWDGPTEGEPKGAIPQMMEAAGKLAGIFDTRIVFLPEGDPGDYEREALNYFRTKSTPAASISRLAVL